MYKIEFKTQEENKQIQELLFQLGFEWKYHNIGKNFHKTHENICYLYAKKDCITTGFRSPEGKEFFESHSSYCKKITLPQLRDLVVLKRNDVNDANWETEGGDQIFKDSNDKSYIYRSDGWDELQRHEMRQAMWEKPKAIAQPQAPALISGADALRALIEGLYVEMSDSDLGMDWTEICVKDGDFYGKVEPCLWMFLNQPEHIKFRLKPELQKKIVNLTKPKHVAQDLITGEVGLVYEDNKVARDVCEYLREEFNLHGV